MLAALLPVGTVVWLSGDLGAGKTCLARGMARGLGVPATEPVTSPTYALMNLYQGRCPLRHFDLYRLDGPEQLEEVGLFEALEQDGITVVEWAERAGGLARHGLLVNLSAGADAGQRRCVITAALPALETVLVELARRWNDRNSHEGL